MKILISESQLKRIFEYIDPIYFLKKKFSKETESIRPEEYKVYEEDFQKTTNIILRLVQKKNKLKHLKGFRVIKVTPTAENWIVLLAPIVDDWFNYKNNESYMKKLKELTDDFVKISQMSGVDSPIEKKGYPRTVEYVFLLQ